MGVSVVTGASGHLGNVLVRRLLEEGEVVRARVRNDLRAADRDLRQSEGLLAERKPN